VIPPADRPTVRIPAARTRPRALEVDYVVVGQRPTVLDQADRPGDGHERTSNGLRKRVPREQRPPLAAEPPALRTGPPAPVVDSPADLSSRLSALRDGIRRGNGHRVGRP
jgi:hypothetical protein